MFKLSLTLIVLLILLTIVPLQGRQFARWWTTLGSFTADLRDEIVPITANNFIYLTNSGFYDGLHFHRVVAGFVIQDGDPLGTGYGGPGYTIQDEFSPLLHHDSPGVLAMAHTSAPNSAGSQYYITLVPTPHLDGSYAIFGKVFEGLDIVQNIGLVPVDANSHPLTNVYIDSLRVLDLVIYNVSPPEDSVAVYDMANPYPFVVEAFNMELSVVFEWFIDDVLQPQFTDLMMEPVFTSTGMHTVKCITSTSEVSWTTLWQVNVTSVANEDEVIASPDLHIISLSPNPFREQTTLNFNLVKALPVKLDIYDCKGRLVSKQNLMGKAGNNSYQWNAVDNNGKYIAPGLYLVKLSTNTDVKVQKAVLLK